MHEPSYVKEARLAQQRFDHNNPVQLEIGGLMADIDVKELVMWVARHSEVDPLTTPIASPFGIQHVVNSAELLDYIHEQTGIPKETLGDWVDKELNNA